jgi:hypothetical protein
MGVLAKHETTWGIAAAQRRKREALYKQTAWLALADESEATAKVWMGMVPRILYPKPIQKRG